MSDGREVSPLIYMPQSRAVRPHLYGGGDGIEVVLQSDLAEVFDFRALQRIIEEIRKGTISKILAGGQIEPGRFTAEVREVPVRQYSARVLRQLLGDEEQTRLHARVPFSYQTRLLVREA